MIHFVLRCLSIYDNKFAIDIMDNDKRIGCVSNTGLNNHDVKCDAFAWWIDDAYKGRGIVPQAVTEYMKVFGPGKTYQAVIYDNNRSSQRVADKCGFTFFSQLTFYYKYSVEYHINAGSKVMGPFWERGTRTYIITYQGVNHVQLSNAA